jgi:hypothetical protein
VLGISEIYLFLAEDSDYRNDRIVNACLSLAGMLSSLCSSHNGLLSELDALTISTLHAVRTACRQETMRYDRVGVPKGEFPARREMFFQSGKANRGMGSRRSV